MNSIKRENFNIYCISNVTAAQFIQNKCVDSNSQSLQNIASIKYQSMLIINFPRGHISNAFIVFEHIYYIFKPV